jgi:hypothetical protein
MAKKRRKPHSRPPAAAAAGGVGTAERSAASDADPAAGNGSTSSDAASAQTRTRQSAGPQRSRAEKKELARRQREEVRRQVRRAEMRRRFLWGAGVATVVAVAVFLIVRPDDPAVRPEELPGELRTEAPWPANAELSLERAGEIGLPAEGTTLHEHANVQVFVNGEPQSVPQGIGITEDGLASLHTHTGDGLVHVESSQVRDFTLGEFFDVWGVLLSPTCIGAYCQQADEELIVFVDGQRVDGPIRDVVLDDQSVIVVTFGTPDELPDPIPTFDFSSIVA